MMSSIIPGPNSWQKINRDWTCKGRKQSPININTTSISSQQLIRNIMLRTSEKTPRSSLTGNLKLGTNRGRTQVPKIWLAAENFVRRNILSPKLLNISCIIKLYQNHIKLVLKHKINRTFSADKTAEISNRCRKFCPPKNFVHRKLFPPKFCPIR